MKDLSVSHTFVDRAAVQQPADGEMPHVAILSPVTAEFRVNHEMVHDTASFSSNWSSLKIAHSTGSISCKALKNAQHPKYNSTFEEDHVMLISYVPSRKPENQ